MVHQHLSSMAHTVINLAGSTLKVMKLSRKIVTLTRNFRQLMPSSRSVFYFKAERHHMQDLKVNFNFERTVYNTCSLMS